MGVSAIFPQAGTVCFSNTIDFMHCLLYKYARICSILTLITKNKELDPVSYVIQINTDLHGYPFLEDVIVNTMQHNLDGVLLKYKH